MRMRRFSVLVVLLFVGLIATACSGSTANITSAQLARGYQDGKAADVTTTFAPTDNPLHCVVTLANAPDDTTVKAVWTLVAGTDASGNAMSNQKIDEKTVTTTGTADFTLTNNSASWPVGNYKVELYLNDTLNQTLQFKVQ